MITSHRPSAVPPKLTPPRRITRAVSIDLAEKDALSRLRALAAENKELRAAQARLISLCHEKGILPRDVNRARKGK